MTNEIKLPTIEEIKNNSIDIEPNYFILINHKTTFIHLCAYEEYPTILDIRMLIAELGGMKNLK